MTLLDAVLFLPLIGFLLLLLIPKSNPALSRMAALNSRRSAALMPAEVPMPLMPPAG